MKLNKKVIIVCVTIILIISIIIGIYFIRRNTSTANDALLEKAYIDIWRDNLMDADIDFYSKGSGANEKNI